jgi:hypothetical protein
MKRNMKEEKKPAKKIWFRRKMYGWGWYPCTIEGVLVTLTFMAAILLAAVIFTKIYRGETIILAAYLAVVFLLGAILVLIAWKKGETPRWCWGKK